MRIAETPFVSIVGAGLAGTLLALRLARSGLRIKLYERFPDPREATVASGRSINLALAERGRHALDNAGLLEAVDRITVPMAGRMIHRLTGEADFQAYGQREHEVIYSVHRDELSQLLLDHARLEDNIELIFYRRLESADFDQRRACFIDDRDDSRHVDDFHLIIGADGAGSALRQSMEAHDGQQASAELLDHAYREFTITPTADNDFAIEAHALHIWPRGGFMLIALPNSDRSFTATLFLARDGEPSFTQMDEYPQRWQHFFEQYFPYALPLLSQVEHDLRHHPVGVLGTIRCDRWQLDGHSLIIGDAAHAVVPFHGQGMNAAFEDVDVLLEMLPGHDDWNTLLPAFERSRIPNTNALADMALENYEEMRQGVRDPRHLARKQLEWELERSYPNAFIPRYSMVMFHRLPYATAYQRGQIQRDILDRLLDIVDEQQRMEQAEEWINTRLPALN
ncbi:MAG: NAD(P)/FAD-dependent oxidoreductase [Wenzhouxiangellaceae bacterium]